MNPIVPKDESGEQSSGSPSAVSERCRLPLHHVYVACNKGEPGAYAACAEMVGYEEYLIDFMAENIRLGAFISRVDCDTGHAMLKEWMEWNGRE